MNGSITVAAVQMCAGGDKRANLAVAERLVRQAAADGAKLVVLPELFNCYGDFPTIVRQAEPIPGPTSQWAAALAAELAITLHAGSICQQAEPVSNNFSGKCFNTSLLFSPQGVLLTQYRKLHLFDIEIPGKVSSRESDFMSPGEEITEFASEQMHIGLATCYDLRFPELFRRLSSAKSEIFLIPAAFTLTTGRDHWELLVRTRAVENQVFVVAANQCGRHSPTMTSYGHSLIVDPWGVKLAEGSEDVEQVVIARLDAARLSEVREKIPCLRHRRLI